MSFTPHKILVTLDNGQAILYRKGMTERHAKKAADRLRALGFLVVVTPQYDPPEESESVEAVCEGIHGK